MSIFTRAKRRQVEPVITGEGSYRLHDLNEPVREEQRFQSLIEAMTSAGSADPSDWFSHHPDRIYSSVLAFVNKGRHHHRQRVISASGVGAELAALQQHQREREERAEQERKRAERAEIDARWAKWKKAVEKERAAREAEEAAKPKLIISYLTLAGESLGDSRLAVEVVTQPGRTDSTDHTETVASCKACGESHTVEWNGTGWDHARWRENRYDTDGKLSTPRAREWAQAHASECRAMPKPE